MERIIKSIEKSVENKNWYSALVLALTLPDICGKFEDKGKSSSKRYSEWFDKYLGEEYDGYLSGNDCYALRCSFLHEGSDDITCQRVKEVLDRFIFSSDGAHLTYLSDCNLGSSKYDNKEVLKVSVTNFCNDIVKATRQWDKENFPDTSEMLEIHEKGIPIGGLLIK